MGARVADKTITPQFHSSLSFIPPGLVPEDNAALTGSYAMVDPQGRVFDNTEGRHTYSDRILDVGVDAAWAGVQFSLQRFLDRGGVYDWTR